MRMTPGSRSSSSRRCTPRSPGKRSRPPRPCSRRRARRPRARSRDGRPRAAGAPGSAGPSAREAARRRASRSRVGPTSSSREHTDRTTRTRARRRAGVCRGVELRVAGSARGARRRMQKAKSAPPLAVRFGDPDAAAGDRGESAREAGDGGAALRREAERQGEKGGQGVRRRREEVTGVDFAIRARRSSLSARFALFRWSPTHV